LVPPGVVIEIRKASRSLGRADTILAVQSVVCSLDSSMRYPRAAKPSRVDALAA